MQPTHPQSTAIDTATLYTYAHSSIPLPTPQTLATVRGQVCDCRYQDDW